MIRKQSVSFSFDSTSTELKDGINKSTNGNCANRCNSESLA